MLLTRRRPAARAVGQTLDSFRGGGTLRNIKERSSLAPKGQVSGPWNRHKKYADVAVAILDKNGTVRSLEPFLTGFVIDNKYVGRPADVLVLKDGSMLVSDDYNGAIYRISYGS